MSANPLLVQFVRYAIVGAAGTAVQYLLLWIGVHFLQMAASMASAVGFVAGALVNYLLNYRYTFASDKAHLQAASKFFAVAGLGLILNTALMHGLVEWLHWHYLVAQVLTTGLVLCWTFSANRWWTFGGARSARPHKEDDDERE